MHPYLYTAICMKSQNLLFLPYCKATVVMTITAVIMSFMLTTFSEHERSDHLQAFNTAL